MTGYDAGDDKTRHEANRSGMPEGASADVRRVTAWGLVANLALSGIKFVFGVVGSSQSLVADAVHSLSDSVTDIAVLVGVSYWAAPADADHPYGHARIETMVTATIGILLGLVGLGIGYHAISEINEKDAARPGWIAFVAACLSIVAKEALYQWNVRVGKRTKSSALLANAWHHRSDALSSVPVAIAVLATRIWPSWGVLDHIAAVIVCMLIVYASWQISWPALRQLSDVGVADEQRDTLLALATSTQGVRAVHALRTRYLGPGLQIDLHVQVDPELTVREGHAIAGAVKHRLLDEGPEVVDVLVHLEPLPDGPSDR
jgi:cation diffusion facilitator family transporter